MWINLTEIEFSIEDLLNAEAMLYGAGLFETLYIDSNGIEYFDAHLDRLQAGAEALNINLPKQMANRELLYRKLVQKFESLDLVQSSLRIQLTKSGDKTLLWGQFRPFLYTESQYLEGFKLGIKPTALIEAEGLSRFKVSNYLRHWHGRLDLKEKGLDEYLWLNPLGKLTEGTVSNYFFLKNGVWYTPRVSEGILPGVMRAGLIASLKENGVKIVEGSFVLADVESAQRIYLTNSLMGVMPVNTFANKPFDVDKNLTMALWNGLKLSRVKGIK